MTQAEIDRVVKLVDDPMPALRVAAFPGGSYPSQAEADRYFSGWTRGQLIRAILEHENNGLNNDE